MPITITLPDDLATRLQRGAQARNQSVEDLAITMLDESLNQNDNQRALEDLVARIKATPPNPNAIRPATGSLAEYLSQSTAAESADEEFDEEEWQRNWDAIEREMKAVTKTMIWLSGAAEMVTSYSVK